jgi:hypothetical protein
LDERGKEMPRSSTVVRLFSGVLRDLERAATGRARELGCAFVAFSLVCAGCRASLSANAKSNGEASADADAQSLSDDEARGVEDERGRVGEFAVDPPGGPAPVTLLGARHDLVLKSGAQLCACLHAAAGQPSDPRFGWEAQVPNINANKELVLAFRGESCPGASGQLGVAYRGYRTTDAGDVVVMVEEAREGRPKPYGAILPRPEGQGRLLIEPYPRSLPYAQPLSGKDCSVSF